MMIHGIFRGITAKAGRGLIQWIHTLMRDSGLWSCHPIHQTPVTATTTANDHIHGDLSPTIKLRQFKYLLRFIAILLGSIQLFTGDWTGTEWEWTPPDHNNII